MGKGVQETVEDGVDAVKHATGGNFFTRLLMAPINVVTGLGKGVFGSLTNIMGILFSGGAFALGAKFMPDLVKWLPLKIKGEKYSDILGRDLAEGGDGALIKHSLAAGAVINAIIGGAKGSLNEVVGSAQGEETSTGGKVAGFIGGAGTIAVIAALALGSAKRNDIGYAGNADDATSKVPGATPNNQGNSKTKGA